jgi:AcrR family transcriptional regulator
VVKERLAVSEETDASRRDRVLSAAIDEFADYGLAGARVDRIAERAEVNKQLIYYYFGDKAGLFDTAIQHMATSFKRVRAALPDDPAKKLVAYFDGATQDQSIIRMLQWEALTHESGTPWIEDVARTADLQQAVSSWREAQRNGVVPKVFDIGQLFLSFQALASHPYAFPQMAKFITGMEVSDPKFVAARRSFLLALGRRLFAAE